MMSQCFIMVSYTFCRYFSLQATQPLGFEEKVRFEVEENICRVEGPLPDCFTMPKKIVLRTVDKVGDGECDPAVLYNESADNIEMQTVQSLYCCCGNV